MGEFWQTNSSISGGTARYAIQVPGRLCSLLFQVITNQYGRPGRAARKWGEDTIEGDLTEDELRRNCHDQNVENAENHFLDDDYYSSRDYDLSNIKVPLLSVANWGGITLHLRGNIEGEGFESFRCFKC